MRSESKYTITARKTHDLLENDKLEVTEVCHLTEKVDRVVYRYKPHVGNMTAQTPLTNNITIACYVTSLSRLRLHSIMENAILRGHKLIYADTGNKMENKILLIYIIIRQSHDKKEPDCSPT